MTVVAFDSTISAPRCFHAGELKPDAGKEIVLYVKAWQAEEIKALVRGELGVAHDCRLRIAVLEHLAGSLGVPL